MAASSGDPRVLLLMNVVLSALFATVVVYGLSIIVDITFGWKQVAIATLALMVLTYLVVIR